MTNRPRNTPKTYTFTKQGKRWFPLVGNTIDTRSAGFTSKRKVHEWARDRELYCQEIVTLKFK